ncbi:hypothetical protein VYU27_005658 [Nannochloropsis oceanica]
MSAPSAPHGPDLVVVQLDDDLPTQGEGSKGGGAAELQQQEQDPISMSQTVAGLLETGNKPVKSTLRGFKVAGTLLKVCTVCLIACAGLLFWTSTTVNSKTLVGVCIAIGIFCIFGSCFSCYGVLTLAGYRSMLQRVNRGLEGGAATVTRASRGESAADIARSIVAETGVVGRVGGRVGGRVVQVLGIGGNNAERATR